MFVLISRWSLSDGDFTGNTHFSGHKAVARQQNSAATRRQVHAAVLQDRPLCLQVESVLCYPSCLSS